MLILSRNLYDHELMSFSHDCLLNKTQIILWKKREKHIGLLQDIRIHIREQSFSLKYGYFMIKAKYNA